MKEDEFIWTTRTGREIPLSELSDQHLCNIAQMMRDEISAAWYASGTLQGEMALITIDGAIDKMERDYNVILCEISRRKGRR